MLRQGITGEVVVRFLVGYDGTVSQVEIVSTSKKEFGESALSTVKQWKFKTCDLDGKITPLQVWTRYKIAYTIVDN